MLNKTKYSPGTRIKIMYEMSPSIIVFLVTEKWGHMGRLVDTRGYGISPNSVYLSNSNVFKDRDICKLLEGTYGNFTEWEVCNA